MSDHQSTESSLNMRTVYLEFTPAHFSATAGVGEFLLPRLSRPVLFREWLVTGLFLLPLAPD